MWSDGSVRKPAAAASMRGSGMSKTSPAAGGGVSSSGVVGGGGVLALRSGAGGGRSVTNSDADTPTALEDADDSVWTHVDPFEVPTQASLSQAQAQAQAQFQGVRGVDSLLADMSQVVLGTS